MLPDVSRSSGGAMTKAELKAVEKTRAKQKYDRDTKAYNAAKKAMKSYMKYYNKKYSVYKIRVVGKKLEYSINNEGNYTSYKAKPGGPNADARPFIAYGLPEGDPYNKYFSFSTPKDNTDSPGAGWATVTNSTGSKKALDKLSGVNLYMLGTTSSTTNSEGGTLLGLWQEYSNALKNYKSSYAAYKKLNPEVKNLATGGGGGGGSSSDKDTSAKSLYAYNDTSLKYNLGAVNFQYFKNQSSSSMTYVPGGNAPVDRIKNANEAFSGQHLVKTKDKKGKDVYKYESDGEKGAKASKGIIQSMVKPKQIDANTSGGTALTPEQAKKDGKELNSYRMGFQFHYNPESLTISWQGSPNVDIGVVMSGADKFGPIGAAGGTGSGFSVAIPINRMSDQQFVQKPEGDWSAIKWESVYGTPLKDQASDKKLSQAPTYDDLRKIRDLGTMYDIEFLLQTILGYKLKSALRRGKHQLTADLGYLGGFPVEIHLGKNMRYYVSITSISVFHKIFTKDMVPILSTVTISCSRLPDYTPSA